MENKTNNNDILTKKCTEKSDKLKEEIRKLREELRKVEEMKKTANDSLKEEEKKQKDWKKQDDISKDIIADLNQDFEWVPNSNGK